MLLIKSEEFSVNDSMCEIKVHGTVEYPFQGYINEERDLRGDGWHWHKEAEFLLVLEGNVRCGSNGKQYVLKKGEGIFINCGALHMAANHKGEWGGKSVSFVFLPRFISGENKGLLYQKYIKPVIDDQNFKGCILQPENSWQKEVLECLEEVYRYCKEDTWSSELLVRNALSRAWMILAEQERPENGIYAEKSTDTKYEKRVKKILEYIERYYGDYITIEDMARQVNISRTECFRCFQKITGQTPLEYLTFYRLGQAAYKLRNTDHSITEICITSGFSQPSYFGKKFREYYGVSPLNYRKQFIIQKNKC